ncbi:hypothetical protein LWI28_023983 [Acer negundo]|uniref:Late embryogenesis abundant protein LEA-2 subgroup domain-containing protein n=1 Tax=Acer negundo TaxID=4023 RepID=A0AAD5J206_ACENE|nr:hypothetical protein LWI28_023983 [Acer negundo]KAK4847388.1 hypothetical protein QYF36_001302 [Acer negundo]
MATQSGKPILQKPPGYRDPTLPVHSTPKLPPRRPILPPSLKQKRKRRSCCRICYCFCFVFILILILVISISTLFFYLWFDPKLPVFHLQSFSFPRFNVTAKTDGNYLNVQTLTRVEVRNPNGKLAYDYGNSKVEISTTANGGDEIDFGSTKVPGFTQAKKNVTSLKIETKSTDQLIEQVAATKLKRLHNNKNLKVKVVVRSSVGLGVGGWKMRPVGFNVICGDMSLKSLDSAMPKCTINMFKWINLN